MASHAIVYTAGICNDPIWRLSAQNCCCLTQNTYMYAVCVVGLEVDINILLNVANAIALINVYSIPCFTSVHSAICQHIATTSPILHEWRQLQCLRYCIERGCYCRHAVIGWLCRAHTLRLTLASFVVLQPNGALTMINGDTRARDSNKRTREERLNRRVWTLADGGLYARFTGRCADMTSSCQLAYSY